MLGDTKPKTQNVIKGKLCKKSHHLIPTFDQTKLILIILFIYFYALLGLGLGLYLVLLGGQRTMHVDPLTCATPFY